MSKKSNIKDIVDKIEKVTKERMLKENVVSLEKFRELKDKKEPPCILVIDDEETIRKSMKRLFEKENYKVLLAADSRELSHLLEDNFIDVILMDVGLPWVNGFELSQMIRESEDLKEIPIIFISGQKSELDVKKAFQAGATDFLEKPIDIKKLKKVVETLLFLTKD